MVVRLQYLQFCLFEMYVTVVFVIRCLYRSRFNSGRDSVLSELFIISHWTLTPVTV